MFTLEASLELQGEFPVLLVAHLASLGEFLKQK